MRKRHRTEYRWPRKLRVKRRRAILELLVFFGLLALVVAAGIYVGAHYHD
jgi:hypothetical protein